MSKKTMSRGLQFEGSSASSGDGTSSVDEHRKRLRQSCQLLMGARAKSAGAIGIGKPKMERAPETPNYPAMDSFQRLDRGNAHALEAFSRQVPSDVKARIIWSNFISDFGGAADFMPKITDALASVGGQEFKIGITSDCFWRAWYCEGHQGMEAYLRENRWKEFHVLTCDRGQHVKALEGELISMVRSHATLRSGCENANPGGEGSVKDALPAFLYVAVN